MAKEQYINVRMDNEIYNLLVQDATKDGENNVSKTVRSILRKHYGLSAKPAMKKGAPSNGR